MVSENRWLTVHVLYKKLQDDNLALRVSIEPSYGHQLQRIDSRLTCKCPAHSTKFHVNLLASGGRRRSFFVHVGIGLPVNDD